MKKTFIIIAAVCAALVSCSKDNGLENGNDPAQEIKASDIKLNISVADLGGDTKAAKTGWVAGDKINLWIDDMDVMSLIGDGKGRAELTLTYDGTNWAGSFDEYYATHASGLLHTIKPTGKLNCLYEGSNDISKYSVVISGYDYTFTLPVKVSAPITPLVCYANAGYTYNSVTNILSAEIEVSDWTALTMIQVVVAGLDSSKAEDYTLSCDNMYNMPGIDIYSDSGYVYAVDPGDTDYPTCGVSNSDGVAFCFYDVWDSDGPFKFTLKDGTNTWTYTASKTLTTDASAVKFISIDKSNFGL